MQRPKRIDLGPLISTYRGRPLSWRDLYLIFLPGVFAVIFPLLYGIWIKHFISLRNGPIAASSSSRLWFILAASSTLCLLLLALIRLYHANIYVSIYRNGLKISLSPINQQIVRWTDILEITNHSTNKRFFDHTVQTKISIIIVSKNNINIRLDQKITHISNLAYEIKKYFFQRKLPAFVNDFKNGKWINFGPVSINKHYFSIQHKKNSWSEVSRVYVKAGYLIIETTDEQNVRIKISQIPNIELFFMLLKRGIYT